ncbi:Oxysterol-binding protein [Coemansia reversa NRRL 1564]|uniref:Oxysterol-binding protein n=1 Tax=Coemansia reversa (strain ATCC 12441 / NRRL 1564) TaxID=763665 RepID=A0A2G5B4M4_COERN|nr:Oxysterol-binding protein [Coemansia reversa NRRL 1564]|eukprot:PIA13941.1 Oxysterol-binding protein [Coemansia reversa NRRL 1564]
MRRDLVRDPDFIEALAQNKLRGSTTSASARSGTAAAAAAADEVTKDVASGLDGRLVATIERVREQLDGFESRITLPAEAGEVNVSLLSILRKNVGKDLSNIAMPLTMNEPLNALQTLCEELTYSVLLQRANEMDDSLDRLMHVAAFAISALSLKKSRVERKPFNPLLGETYELVDPRSEFRFIAEKVSHHPPVMACHADAPGFRLWQDSSGRSRFWGKSIELVQTSHMHIELPRHADHFTYAKPSALVRGLLAGSRTIDFTGEITILNRSTGDRCVVLFKEGGIFSPSNDAVECRLFRAGSDHAERVLRGSWSAELLYERSPARSDVLWAAAALPPDAARFYFFSYFAMRLNELPPPPLRGELPLTDTRFRPDQRAYEEGRLEEAEELKTRLEDAQRVRNRERAAAGTSWVPLWFELREDSDSQSGHAWAYKGGYWEARARHAFPPSLPLWDDPNNSGSLIGLSN